MLSMGFVIQYGNFRFWTGGDIQPSFLKKGFATKDGPVNYEAEVGRRIGPVTICKTNHHGCGDAMCDDFIRTAHAQAYITCVWSHWHVDKSRMESMASRDLHPSFDPLIIPNFMPTDRAKEHRDRPFMRTVSHVATWESITPSTPDMKAHRRERPNRKAMTPAATP